MLQKYTPDLTHVVDWGKLVVDANGTFEEGPICIMDSWDQVLRGKTVRLVKVLWQHRGIRQHGKAKTLCMSIIFSYLRMKVCF